MGKEHGSFVADILIKSNLFIICRSCISVIKKICDTKTMFSKNLGMALPQTTCISIPNCSGDASADHSYSIERFNNKSTRTLNMISNCIISCICLLNQVKKIIFINIFGDMVLQCIVNIWEKYQIKEIQETLKPLNYQLLTKDTHITNVARINMFDSVDHLLTIAHHKHILYKIMFERYPDVILISLP